jgi:hypothetical protein
MRLYLALAVLVLLGLACGSITPTATPTPTPAPTPTPRHSTADCDWNWFYLVTGRDPSRQTARDALDYADGVDTARIVLAGLVRDGNALPGTVGEGLLQCVQDGWRGYLSDAPPIFATPGPGG